EGLHLGLRQLHWPDKKKRGFWGESIKLIFNFAGYNQHSNNMCVFVYTYLCIYICMYVCIYVCIYIKESLTCAKREPTPRLFEPKLNKVTEESCRYIVVAVSLDMFFCD
ncbi:mCG144938, partial [Mus musculus]